MTPRHFEEDARTQRRRMRHARPGIWHYTRRLAIWAAVLAGGVALLATVRLPSWLDPEAPAAYDAWARDICQLNDAIDGEARTLLPYRRVEYDPDFLTKTENLSEQKRALLADVQVYQPVVWRRGVHRQLEAALEDSIRHHAARRAQFIYTDERVAAVVRTHGAYPEDLPAIWDTIAQSYPDPEYGLRRGKAYQRMYDTVRERVGLEPVAVWPPPPP